MLFIEATTKSSQENFEKLHVTVVGDPKVSEKSKNLNWNGKDVDLDSKRCSNC